MICEVTNKRTRKYPAAVVSQKGGIKDNVEGVAGRSTTKMKTVQLRNLYVMHAKKKIGR